MNAEGPEPKSPTKSADEHSDGDDSNQKSPREEDDGEGAEDGGIGSFGGLMKTLATRSESVIETFRRDLKEFGSELQKETGAIRDVAIRDVANPPV